MRSNSISRDMYEIKFLVNACACVTAAPSSPMMMVSRPTSRPTSCLPETWEGRGGCRRSQRHCTCPTCPQQRRECRGRAVLFHDGPRATADGSQRRREAKAKIPGGGMPGGCCRRALLCGFFLGSTKRLEHGLIRLFWQICKTVSTFAARWRR